MKLRSILLWWILGYWVITLVGIGHTVFNWLVLGMDGIDPEVGGMYGIVAYANTVPWHVLYNIILWPLFAYACLRKVPRQELLGQAFKLGAIWLGLSIAIDLVGWVLIPHAWQCTFTEFYIDYQPWITLIYFAIFLMPVAMGAIMKVRKTAASQSIGVLGTA